MITSTLYVDGSYPSADIKLTPKRRRPPALNGSLSTSDGKKILTAGAHYSFTATVHNDSAVDEIGTVVTFWRFDSGVSWPSWYDYLGSQTVTVPKNGTLDVISPNEFIAGPASFNRNIGAIVSISNPNSTEFNKAASTWQEIPSPRRSDLITINGQVISRSPTASCDTVAV
jgi:hypothetical protein